MTIKHHIILSATITVALITLIACQQKTQAPQTEDLPKAVTEQTTKVEEVAKNFEQEVKTEAKETEVKINEEIQKAEEEVKETEETAKAEAEEAVKEAEAEVKKVEEKIEPKEEQGPQNLIANSDFSEGFKGWHSSKGASIIQENGKNCLELTGQTNYQARVWQTINTTSGHVYRLTFKAKANQNAAFVILRDDQTKQEKYFYTSPTADWKKYSKEFVSNKDGEYRVFLSCHGKGKFYYSEASIVEKATQE